MIRVWDLFVRISHWLIVLLVISAWLSANYGDAEFKWHTWNGYAIFILVVSRIIWGIVGSSTARFSYFIKSPFNAIVYLINVAKGKELRYLGHNPAGGWMVVFLLLVLLFQSLSGMFSSDDILAEGPFAYFVQERVVSILTGLHHLGFDILMILVALHLLAVAYHQFIKKEKIIEAMIHGQKIAPKKQALVFYSFVFSMVIVGGVAGILWLVLNYYS